jgi:hypothetical protein
VLPVLGLANRLPAVRPAGALRLQAANILLSYTFSSQRIFCSSVFVGLVDQISHSSGQCIPPYALVSGSPTNLFAADSLVAAI